MARLIVNADDFGLTSGVNRAILESNREGIVTSATLMANARALPEAVSLLRSSAEYQTRKLGVGCHLVLIDGAPLSPPASIPSLLDRDSQGQRFPKKMWKFALSAVQGKVSSSEVELEATAQIRKLLDAGVELSHVDCHKHSHMFPVILEGVLRAAKARGIRAIRNPFEPSFARPVRVAISGKNAVRSVETALLNAAYAKQFRQKVREYGLATTDGSIGVTLTGTLDLHAFLATIQNLPNRGTYEFVCHPGYNDAELATAGTRLLQSRESELSVLCSKEAREALKASGVELITFRDLVAASESNHAATHPMR